MDKLLLTLTLLAFSSGVLCNVAQNLTEGGPTTAETQLNNTVYKLVKVCTRDELRDDYVVIQGMGAYKLHKQPWATWNDARKTCIDEGGQLAIINSDAEGTILVDWLKGENIAEAWIGTHDMFRKGHWVTLTGETLAAAGYDHWLPDQPDNAGGTEHCGTLHQHGGMNDLTCSRTQSYFCKIILC